MPAIAHQNKILGDDIQSIHWSQAKTSVKKNLLKNTATSTTINGITFTVNSDGSVTANGTATSNARLIIASATALANACADSDIILSGCPSGGSENKYQIYTRTSAGYLHEYGDSIVISQGTSFIEELSILVSSGQTVSNIVFKPMIRLASIADATYEPYIPDNTEVMRYTDNALLGAKNLLPNNATSQTVNHVTFTVNADGTITANGTATADIYYTVYNTSPSAFVGAIDCILSGTPSGGSVNFRLYVRTSNSGYYSDLGDGVLIPASDDGIVTATIFIASGQTASNVTFKPMIRLATDTDDTYVPYAMTNRELTEESTSKISSFTFAFQGSTVTVNRLVKRGNVVTGTIVATLNQSVSAWTDIATVPADFTPNGDQYIQIVNMTDTYSAFSILQMTPTGHLQSASALASGKNIRFTVTWVIR